jgi:phosphoglycerate kinase
VLDIGPETVALYAAFAEAKTVVWNGPMGVFEMEPFAEGTFAVAKAWPHRTPRPSSAGGTRRRRWSSLALPTITHISTGGGASLEFLEGKELPGHRRADRQVSRCQWVVWKGDSRP